MKPKLHFSRFEFKYVLPATLRDEIERELGYFMSLDPYVEKQRRQKYFVRSLYFDDDVYTCYYEKTDGIAVRRKYRIRTYTNEKDKECVVFMEIKGRYNALVFKHRVQLPGKLTKSLEQGHGIFMAEIMKLADSGDNVITSFLFDAIRMRLKPKVLIDYDRRPYISKYDPEFRVTFDDSLGTVVTRKLFPDISDKERIFLPGYSIIEVKFKRLIPSWFHRIIQSYELRRVSVSKYCQGVERAGLALNLE